MFVHEGVDESLVGGEAFAGENDFVGAEAVLGRVHGRSGFAFGGSGTSLHGYKSPFGLTIAGEVKKTGVVCGEGLAVCECGDWG